MTVSVWFAWSRVRARHSCATKLCYCVGVGTGLDTADGGVWARIDRKERAQRDGRVSSLESEGASKCKCVLGGARVSCVTCDGACPYSLLTYEYYNYDKILIYIYMRYAYAIITIIYYIYICI